MLRTSVYQISLHFCTMPVADACPLVCVCSGYLVVYSGGGRVLCINIRRERERERNKIRIRKVRDAKGDKERRKKCTVAILDTDQ